MPWRCGRSKPGSTWTRSSAAKIPREYDAAVAVLLDLRALAERDGDGNAFSQRFRQLREQHLRKPSLIQRLAKAELGPQARKSGMTRD